MDLLQRELARKKEALEGSGNSSNKRKKTYRKQGELRRLEEEKEEREQEEKEAKRRRKRESRENDASANRHDHAVTDGKSSSKRKQTKKQQRHRSEEHRQEGENSTASPSSTTAQSKSKSKNDTTHLSPHEVKERLRSFGLPVHLFGETVAEIAARLALALAKEHKALQGLSEMEEFRLGQGHGIRNTFLEKDSQAKTLLLEQTQQQQEEQERKKKKEEEDEMKEDDSDDPPKQIYKWLKGLLKHWEGELEKRPDAVIRSVAGRNELKTCKQCKDYIRPLFKQLKKRTIEPGMQAHLFKIMSCSKDGEFVQAHDAYMDVAIGRAAWPIGVTMVGIHARTGREKIESSNVAHVMNSESQRKYLTSVKRLLSYAQKIRPDVDPSKKVMN